MSASSPLRVMLVNDFAIVATGLVSMLAPFADRVVAVGDPWTPGEGPAADVDVVLYDTYGSLPLDEERIYDWVRPSAAKLVVYSWAYDDELVSRAMRAGAAGYLSKRMEPAQVVAALELIHTGERVTPGAGRLANRSEHGDWPGSTSSLSQRESEVIALLAKGMTNQDIANRTFLSVNSIKTYLKTAYRKMGVESRSQAVLWALEHGFTPGRIVVGGATPSDRTDDLAR